MLLGGVLTPQIIHTFVYWETGAFKWGGAEHKIDSSPIHKKKKKNNMYCFNFDNI